MKKVLSLVLAFALVVGLFSMSFAAVPSDVAGTPYEKAVERLMAFGIVTGDNQGVRPNDSINRQEFIATLVRSLGMKAFADMSKGQTKFSDVPAGSWASGVINVATGTITNGYPDGTFGYGNEVTYAEAITMIVRALGYRTPAMDANYPNSYLYKANEIDLIKDVENMTKNGAATRGNIFLMLDNALEQPMVSVNSNGGFDKIQSNSADVNMLSKLDTKTVEGTVTAFSSKKLIATIGGEKVRVDEDFDFKAVEGLKVRVWVDGDDKLISMKIVDNAIYTAAKYTAKTATDDAFITIDDVDYDISTATGVSVELDEVTLAADNDVAYAKVVFNEDDEVIYFEGHSFSGNILVRDVNESREILYGYDGVRKVKDYTIVKDGKEITVEDIEDGDVVLYNAGKKYAVVYNNVVEGEITKVYTNSFKLDGEEYKTDGDYINGDKTANLDADKLKQMKDEGDIKVYLNTKNEVLYVDGELGEPNTSSFYALITKNSVTWNDASGKNWSLNVIKQDGEAHDYKLSDDFVKDVGADKSVKAAWDNTASTGNMIAGKYVKITVDEDGEVTYVDNDLATPVGITSQATDSKYVEKKKVSDSVVVFEKDASDINDTTVTTWGELDYDEITAGNVILGTNDVLVVEVTTSTKKSNTTEEKILVTDVKKDEETGIYEVTYELNGSEEFATSKTKVDDGKFYTVDLDQENEEITTPVEITYPSSPPTPAEVDGLVVTLAATDAVDLTDGTITDNTSGTARVFELNGAVIYNKAFEQISLDEIKDGDQVKLFFDGDSDYYIMYAQVVTP